MLMAEVRGVGVPENRQMEANWSIIDQRAGITVFRLCTPPERPHQSGYIQRPVKALKAELRRKDKALAETAALLVLQKKVQAIWGERCLSR